MGTLVYSVDQNEMLHKAAFIKSLLILKQSSSTKIQFIFEIATCDHLKYKQNTPKFIVSICMGKSIRMKKVQIKAAFFYSWYMYILAVILYFNISCSVTLKSVVISFLSTCHYSGL